MGCISLFGNAKGDRAGRNVQMERIGEPRFAVKAEGDWLRGADCDAAASFCLNVFFDQRMRKRNTAGTAAGEQREQIAARHTAHSGEVEQSVCDIAG
jgi:hypothetical protein